MSEAQSGYAFLKELHDKNHRKDQTFDDFSDYLEKKAREQGVPLNGQFELTPLCNFDCGMCYVHMTREQMQGHSPLTAEQWKGLMHEAWEQGMLRVTLTGGECLAYPGFKDLYLYLHSLGCEVAVMTNGSLLDERWVRFFQAHRPADIFITLYGSSEEVYERTTGRRAFENVVRGIRMIQETGIRLSLTVTPNEALGEDVFETIRLAKRLCPDIRVNPWLSAPREETGRAASVKELDEDFYVRIFRLKNELEGVKIAPCPAELPKPGGPQRGVERGLLCGGGRSGFTINWQGVMSPCCDMSVIRSYPLRDGFAQAWRQINQAAEAWPRAAECEGCAYQQVCEKCAATVMHFAEPGTRPTALCERTIRFVRQGVAASPVCE